MDSVIDAVVEIFAWAGFGLGVLLAGLALILYLIDGTWVPTRAVVEDSPHGPVVRWFDEDGGVNEARLSPDEERKIEGKEMADIFYRRGAAKARLTHGSPAVRGVALLAAGLVGLGVLALAISWVLLFVRG